MNELPLVTSDTCCELTGTVIDAESATRVALMFKALGDPVRLRLAALIASRPEVCVCDLQTHFTLSGPTISHHLKVLREADLIGGERRGTWVYYWINPDALRSLSVLLSPSTAVPAVVD